MTSNYMTIYNKSKQFHEIVILLNLIAIAGNQTKSKTA